MRMVLALPLTVLLFADAAHAETWAFSVTADPRAGTDSWKNALTEIREGAINSTLPSTSHPFGKSELVITCGDIDPLQTRYGDFTRVFSSASVKPLFLVVVGNHEFENSATHYNYARDQLVPKLTSAVRNSTNDCSYYIDHKNARFICVDAYRGLGANGCLNTNGTAWATKAVEEAPSRIRHIFISLHDPAFPRRRHVGDSFDQCKTERNAFWNMLVANRNRVRTVWVGHTHYYYKMRVKDPASAAANDASKYPSDPDGVYQVDVGAAGNGGMNTVVTVQIEDDAVYYRAIEAVNGLNKTFSVKEEWSEIPTAVVDPVSCAASVDGPSYRFLPGSSPALFFSCLTDPGDLTVTSSDGRTVLKRHLHANGGFPMTVRMPALAGGQYHASVKIGARSTTVPITVR